MLHFYSLLCFGPLSSSSQSRSTGGSVWSLCCSSSRWSHSLLLCFSSGSLSCCRMNPSPNGLSSLVTWIFPRYSDGTVSHSSWVVNLQQKKHKHYLNYVVLSSSLCQAEVEPHLCGSSQPVLFTLMTPGAVLATSLFFAPHEAQKTIYLHSKCQQSVLFKSWRALLPVLELHRLFIYFFNTCFYSSPFAHVSFVLIELL